MYKKQITASLTSNNTYQVVGDPIVLTGDDNLVAFDVYASRAVSGFIVQVSNDGTNWFDFLAETDFDQIDLQSLQFCTSTGPHELGIGERSMTLINVGGVEQIRFKALPTNSSGATTDLTINVVTKKKG